MTSKGSLASKAFYFFLALQLAGITCPAFIPKAHALYWEDEGDDNNNPDETKRRPDHFSLFDWVGGLQHDAKRNDYRAKDNHDNGPGVNGGARTQVILASAVVGLAAGLFLSSEFTTNSNDLSTNMFIGGALGLGAGIGVGALIMPGDYNVDQQAKADFLKERQAWSQDPTRMRIAQSFRPAPVAFSFQF